MDVFLMPSLFEGLPITGIEAQANGLPCIFADSITKELKITKQAEYCSYSIKFCSSCLGYECIVSSKEREDGLQGRDNFKWLFN